ncbi:hypothetical protein NNO07_24100 [Pseudomonas resinovorans]|uniref:Uncharacterized protein n=1 Tax=Metapseudomonas resinovorans TaxID=53412 RepID=A0ABT4YB89_METRE|nr:hypothetical protein [Pseudomonas resinovorans]MDA8486158.1 hypothetical protein [Pseudomonas resinovorans]
MIAAETELGGILQHDGQQLAGGFTAEYRSLEASSQQIGHVLTVIDWHVTGDQDSDRIQEKRYGQGFGSGLAFDQGLRTMEQAAIDLLVKVEVHQQLVAVTGDTALGAMTQGVGVIHVATSMLVR